MSNFVMIDGIHEYLNQDFKRIYESLDDEPFISRGIISYNDVLKAHYLIANQFINEGETVTYGVKDKNILGSALGRQLTGLGGYSKWEKPEEICATLFYGLIKNHAFHDVNKRTALLTLLYQLHKFGRTIKVKQIEFERLAVNVADDNYETYNQFKKFKNKEDPEVLFIADFIHHSTRAIDKKYYLVTFHDFNRLLKRYNCYIEEVGGNFANVVKIKKKGWFVKEDFHEKIKQIGFPGWKKQVDKNTLREVLKSAELTEKKGIDSEAFFKEGQPLSSLIDIYYKPLSRLRDK